jgi:hypothetical protein
MVNSRILTQCDYQVMQIRFGQGRDEIDAGLFERIDDLRRHFSFQGSSRCRASAELLNNAVKLFSMTLTLY